MRMNSYVSTSVSRCGSVGLCRRFVGRRISRLSRSYSRRYSILAISRALCARFRRRCGASLWSSWAHVQDESRHYAWQSRTRERHVAKILSFIRWRTATKRDKRELEVWLRQEGGGSAPTSEKLFEFAYQRLRHLRIELEYSP